MENELMKYDELVGRFEAAYAAHERMYQARQPKPERTLAKRDSLIVPVALIALIIASVIVSGSRTIVEFGGGLVGASAFVMIELGIVAYAFFRTRRSTDTDKKRLEDVQRLAGRGLKLVVVVAVGANVHAVLKQEGIALDGNINTVIQVLVAISAPVLALISGDVLALETVVSSARQRRLDEEYEQIVARWREGMNASWNNQKGRLGIKIEVSSDTDRQQTDKFALSDASVLSVSAQTDNRQTHQAAYGYSRTPDGQARVIEYLNANPNDAQLPSRKLAELVGVGHDTANKGRNAWRTLQNGQGTDA